MALSSQKARQDVHGGGKKPSGPKWLWAAVAVGVFAVGASAWVGYSKGWFGGEKAQSLEELATMGESDGTAGSGKNTAEHEAAPPSLTFGLPKRSSESTPGNTPGIPPGNTPGSTTAGLGPAHASAAPAPAPGGSSTASGSGASPTSTVTPLAPSSAHGKPSSSVTPSPSGGAPVGPVTRGPASGGPAHPPGTIAPSTQATQPRVAVNDLSEPIAQAMKLVETGQLVQGRARLTALLFSAEDEMKPLDAQMIRDTLNSINQDLFFSPNVRPGDPLVESYVVQQGDLLAKLAPRQRVTYQLLEEVNKIDARRLGAGRKIKLVRGPLHAIVHKKKFVMDVFAQTATGEPVLVHSFKVGLGESNSTPVGSFVVKNKVANPGWANPRTGQAFAADDPKNPIGEFWIGLEGADEASRRHTSYGIHGTIEPESVGRQASMGCVRLRDADIALVYKMLTERGSTVVIQDR